ncbi:helix-turn-helix transcriptional regulator [Chondrinema litorale]|uniref:helix-turn-helix transcriptional regulator n=1 Tax=Chondrinema litorale TaxID=2994555 RepID=UPI00254275C1|nr:AraC family transcriptional regulator [Chondrinema litorale]UZR99687.1 AraC family transcriptional regulator [Chondrinema litorale]
MILGKLAENNHTQDTVPVYFDHCILYNEFDKPFVFPTHFTSFGIIALLEGSGNFKINDVHINLDQNSFVIVNRGSKVSFSVNQKPQQKTKTVYLYFNHVLSQLVARDIFHNLDDSGLSNKSVDDYSLIEHIHFNNASLKANLLTLLSLGDSCASFQALKADMLIRKILEDIIAENYAAFRISDNMNVIKQSTKVNLYKRIAMAKNWMETHFSLPIKLTELADIAMINSQHFLRFFKKAYGITPHQYLTEIRLNQAKKLLVSSTKSVTDICFELGFESLSSFSILFKKHTGYSPKKYKMLHMLDV